MAGTHFLTPEQVLENIKKVKSFVKEQGLDALYISSFDPFLSEYVPMEENHRYYFTRFTGSMAEVLVTANDKVMLFVDGRYFEQADMEVDLNEVEVVKCAQNTGLLQNLLDRVSTLGVKNLGIEADRTPLSYLKKFENITKVTSFAKRELHQAVDFRKFTSDKAVNFVEKKYRGSDTKEKLKRVIANSNEAYFLTALDNVAWITNCRGYHLPHLSSFLGRALMSSDKVYVLVDHWVKISDEARKQAELEFIQCSDDELAKNLKELSQKLNLKTVFYDSSLINSADYTYLSDAFGPATTEKAGGLTPWQSIKEAAEMDEMRRSFNISNKAIYDAIVKTKADVSSGAKVTERDLFDNVNNSYKAQGSIEQSFNTIAGVDANGSIIHYGSSSDQVNISKDSLCLIDSGGYYEGGFATDTTRAFLASDAGSANDKMKEIYTLVLKGTLQLQYAVFPEGALGSSLDMLARMGMYHKGYNYNHGTGHGVGIHVHEAGVRISPISTVPMKAGQVVSIEPGIYIPKFGGVRLENIAIVEKHPEFEGFLRFENLTWIGFDHNLINYSMLSQDELAWLKDYEQECIKRGTAFISSTKSIG